MVTEYNPLPLFPERHILPLIHRWIHLYALQAVLPSVSAGSLQFQDGKYIQGYAVNSRLNTKDAAVFSSLRTIL